MSSPHIFDLYLYECHIGGRQLHVVHADRAGRVATIRFQAFVVREEATLSCVIVDGDGRLISIGAERQYSQGEVLHITYEVNNEYDDASSEPV